MHKFLDSFKMDGTSAYMQKYLHGSLDEHPMQHLAQVTQSPVDTHYIGSYIRDNIG